MSLIPGKYKLETNENLIPFLIKLGYTEEKAGIADKLRPTVDVKVSGDKVEIISDSGVKNSHQTYILGQETDDPLPSEHIAKSVARIEGNKILIDTKCVEINLEGKRTYEFSEDGMVLIYHHPDGEARRIYKRV